MQRINYYVSHEQYKYVNQSQSKIYIENIKNFIDLFLQKMNKDQIKHFDDLYDGEYHPDMIDLYQLI